MPKAKSKAEEPVQDSFPEFSFRTAILLTIFLTVLGLLVATMPGPDLIGGFDQAKYFIFVLWGIFFSVIGPLILLSSLHSSMDLPNKLMTMATGLVFILIVLLIQPGVSWPIIMSVVLLILGLTTTVVWFRTRKA